MSKLNKNFEFSVANSNSKSTKSKTHSKAIISTAFQDHITKQLQLDNNFNPFMSNNLFRNNQKPIKSIYIKPKIDTGLNNKSLLAFFIHNYKIKIKIQSKLEKNLTNKSYDEDKEYVIAQPDLENSQTLG
jgi:hypothetical protein